MSYTISPPDPKEFLLMHGTPMWPVEAKNWVFDPQNMFLPACFCAFGDMVVIFVAEDEEDVTTYFESKYSKLWFKVPKKFIWMHVKVRG